MYAGRMAYCTECGNQVGEDDKFCRQCGAAQTKRSQLDSLNDPSANPFQVPEGTKRNSPAGDVSKRRTLLLIAAAVIAGFAATLATRMYVVNSQPRERTANPNSESFP